MLKTTDILTHAFLWLTLIGTFFGAVHYFGFGLALLVFGIFLLIMRKLAKAAQRNAFRPIVSSASDEQRFEEDDFDPLTTNSATGYFMTPGGCDNHGNPPGMDLGF